MTLNNIKTIARYEVKLLRRSWLFRIFAILAVFGITFALLASLTTVFFPFGYQWPKVAVPSFFPFFSTFYYNIAQSVIAIFLAGNFLQRDKKLDTAEVIYVRPMSNADYIIGKTLGILQVFISLNVLVLAITAFLNILITKSPFSLYPYLFYIVTVSVPSLLFVLGLSFTVMSVLKNQAVTFIVMLGIIGTVFFYLSDTLSGVFDFFGVNIPSAFSEVTGHADIRLFLLQRSIYLLCGIGLICLVIGLVKRLPHKPWKAGIAKITGSAFLLAGMLAGMLYVMHYHHQLTIRKEYIASYNEYNTVKKTDILSHQLTIHPQGNFLSGESILRLKNRYSVVLDKIILYLNPSLEVVSVTANNRNIPFRRDKQVIILDTPLQSGAEDTLTIHYQGRVSEDICYTDVPEAEYLNTKHPFDYPIRIGKRYAWLEESFTLLTPECIWYPVTVPPSNPASPYETGKTFTEFSLNVISGSPKSIVSQGKSKQTGDTTRFTNRFPLPGISLTIADYDKKSIRVDSVDYEIYYFKGHDYFSAYFDRLGDTLPGIIRELKNDIEIGRGRDYPFDKFILAETPVQFESYIRNWKGYTEYIQPEIVFIPERGSRLYADFQVEKNRMQRWQRRDQGAPDETEMSISIFNRFFNQSFNDESLRTNWEKEAQINPFHFATLFYGHTGFVRSDRYPVIDIVLNTMQGIIASPERFRPWQGFINNKQRANLYLENHNFRTAVADTSLKAEIFYELMKLKSEALNNYIISQAKAEDFKHFVKDFYTRRQFSVIPLDTLTQQIKQHFNLDLAGFMEEWYTTNHSPALSLTSADVNEVIIDEFSKYQVKFKVNNPSDANAIITVYVQQGGGNGGRRGGGGSTPSEARNYVIPAKSAQEIKIITDERPSSMSVNTNISQNLPPLHFFNFPKVENTVNDTASGIFPIDPGIFRPNSNEIIIDNEDPGFRTISSNTRHKLKDLFRKKDDEKYKNISYWRPPSQWTHTAADYCYGETVHSAVYKNKGSGANAAEWKARIEREGYYEVSIWNPKPTMFSFGRRNRKEQHTQAYEFRSEQEKETITLNLDEESAGWVPVGNFYLPEGTVTITLTDKTSGRFVIADAVKFTFTD